MDNDLALGWLIALIWMAVCKVIWVGKSIHRMNNLVQNFTTLGFEIEVKILRLVLRFRFTSCSETQTVDGDRFPLGLIKSKRNYLEWAEIIFLESSSCFWEAILSWRIRISTDQSAQPIKFI